MLQLQNLESTIIRTTSSREMDSAQLISMPLAFQPGMRVHVNHLLLRAMPMLQLVDVSTHKSGSSHLCGLRKWEQRGLSSTASHKCRLSMTDLGGWQVAKSFGNLMQMVVAWSSHPCR